jgi:hypothetical protein
MINTVTISLDQYDVFLKMQTVLRESESVMINEWSHSYKSKYWTIYGGGEAAKELAKINLQLVLEIDQLRKKQQQTNFLKRLFNL